MDRCKIQVFYSFKISFCDFNPNAFAQSEKIYKLKGEMRKRDLFIDEFQKKVNFALRTISEFKNRSEGKSEGEATRIKRLKGT
jgi:hypothetical protein